MSGCMFLSQAKRSSASGPGKLKCFASPTQKIFDAGLFPNIRGKFYLSMEGPEKNKP
jgi:hypothetical protein